jgi:DNA-directed RNA polymerase specialized sigma24 family protein
VIAQASCTDRNDLEDWEVLQYNKEFLFKLINMIDGKRREIILRHLDGLSHGEIAAERGIQYHNVTELKRLAIQNIREAIQESGIEWEYLYD